MPMQRRKIQSKTEKRKGRIVTEGTAWWMDRSPKGYAYYCAHNVLLADSCKKCERESNA